MTGTKKGLLVEEIMRVINSFNPEYIEMADNASKMIYGLVDDIEEFEDECNQPDSKEEALREIELENIKALNL